MIFSSFRFLVFLPLVLALYYAHRDRRWRNGVLLVASYVFYGSWDPRFLWLLVGSTLLDFITGAMIARTSVAWQRRCWLALSVAGNVGSLICFKYADFFIVSFQELMQQLGVQVNVPLLHLVLPLGISFFNFQTMTYSLDIYRGRLAPTRSFLDFSLFVVFFPQLVAGPIVRAVELLPQIERGVATRWADVVTGVNRFAEGFAKKVLVADSLAPYVDRVFANAGDFDAATLWCASVGFAVQCYCDFAGYTDMAIGCARLFGFRLPENFRWPFLARNVAEFWRRWHITLYSFMRDYLYFALGGSRVGPLRQMLNALFTMMVVGLWHGAAWNFVLWGLYNGLLMVGHRLLSQRIDRMPIVDAALSTLPGRILCIATTDLLFFLSFTLFRSRGAVSEALDTGWRMLTLQGAGARELDVRVPLAFAAVILCSLACEGRWRERFAARAARLGGLAVPAQAVGYALLILALVLFSPHGTQSFVYFQF